MYSKKSGRTTKPSRLPKIMRTSYSSWNNRKGQPNLNEATGSHSGGTAFGITDASTRSKYLISAQDKVLKKNGGQSGWEFLEMKKKAYTKSMKGN